MSSATVLSNNKLTSFRAFERVLQTLLGAGELRDCTIDVRPTGCRLPKGMVVQFDLYGNFLFEGDEKHPQDVRGNISVCSTYEDGVWIGKLEWDAWHVVVVNGIEYRVSFHTLLSPKAFVVFEKDGAGNWCVCARSDEYVEALKLAPDAKIFA